MKILIASDGSEFGLSAVYFAANLIDRDREAQIKVVTVVEPAAAIELETLIEAVEDLTAQDNPFAQRANEIGERSAKLLLKKCGSEKVEISHEVLGGPAARMIVERAQEWKADLIIVGSHGQGFWSRALLGSVSNRIVNHAPCSVLVVR